MKQLKHIGVWSTFRMSLFLGAVAGLIYGCILMYGSFSQGRYSEGLFFLVGSTIVYALIGAVVNVIMVWVYNKVAERLGGIEVDIE